MFTECLFLYHATCINWRQCCLMLLRCLTYVTMHFLFDLGSTVFMGSTFLYMEFPVGSFVLKCAKTEMKSYVISHFIYYFNFFCQGQSSEIRRLKMLHFLPRNHTFLSESFFFLNPFFPPDIYIIYHHPHLLYDIKNDQP